MFAKVVVESLDWDLVLETIGVFVVGKVGQFETHDKVL